MLWLVGVVAMFAGTSLILWLAEGTFRWPRSEFIALLVSSSGVVPHILAERKPLHVDGKPVSRSDSWLFYVCLFEAALASAAAVLSPGWMKFLAVGSAIGGTLIAWGVSHGKMRGLVRS